jgi:hypothetical protein
VVVYSSHVLEPYLDQLGQYFSARYGVIWRPIGTPGLGLPPAPVLSFLSPVVGTVVTGNNVNIRYRTSGGLLGVSHVHFQLGSGPDLHDTDFDGVFQIADVPEGRHVLTGHLVRADHTRIPGTETSVRFTVSGTKIFSAKSPKKILSPGLVDGINDQAEFGLEAEEVSIFDVKGNLVFAKTMDETSGETIIWNCLDAHGQIVPAGLYVAKIKLMDGSRVHQTFAVVK